MDFTNILNNTITLVLLSVLALTAIALGLHYGMQWLRVGLSKKGNVAGGGDVAGGRLPSVSVVIVAQNEAELLKNSLVYLLEQDYPDYEVVVVDYTSHDDTPFVLRVCSENYKNLKPITFHEDVNMFRGKKYPLSIGIKSATKEIILLTEPDSVPASFNWIREMVAAYKADTSIVLGYSLLTRKKSLLNTLEQYDNLMLNASMMGMALAGKPYTSSGRNLSFRRDFFFRQGAFISHYTFPYGAEELFVNQNATRKNTAIVMPPSAEMESHPHDTLAQWRLDRKQRLMTWRRLKKSDQLLTSAHPVALTLFYASLLWLWIAGLFPWQILLGVLLLKVIWQTVAVFFLAKRFKIKNLAYFSFFLELYFLLSNTILAITSLRRKNSI